MLKVWGLFSLADRELSQNITAILSAVSRVAIGNKALVIRCHFYN